MQIRCYSCKMPISIGRASVEQALTIIHEEDLVYFDFRCPKCKKSNRVSKEQLMHASPAWVYEPTEKTEKKKEPAVAKKSGVDKTDPKGSEPKKTPTKKAPAKKTPSKKEPVKKTKK